MVSEFAMEDIEDLARHGITLTPREIIRLNALGLRTERGEDVAQSTYCLPRVAWLGDIALREPTVAHEVWLDEVERTFDMNDVSTHLAVTAYALTVVNADLLPPPTARIRIWAKLVAFRRRIRHFTPAQIVAAMRYVTEGRYHANGEYAPIKPNGKDEPRDESFSVAVGALVNGVAICSNISVGDANLLTRSQLERIVEKSVRARIGGESYDKTVKEDAAADYYATLDKIKADHHGDE